MALKKVTSDYDVVFISWLEPNKDFHFDLLQRLVPNAKRVDGIVGFDAAHKAAAKLATTERVLIVDGDASVWDLILDLVIDDEVVPKNSVVSWSAINRINGLTYGNGGPKLWPTELLANVESHEAATSSKGTVDFFDLVDYVTLNSAVCETVQNGSAAQAFCAGYREGVKMSMVNGKYTADKELLLSRSKTYNFQRLSQWCSVGVDEEYGEWAMYGARLGWYHTCVSGFSASSNPPLVNSVLALHELANSFGSLEYLKDHVDYCLSSVNLEEYGIQMLDLSPELSKYVKYIGYGRLRNGNERPII